MDKVLKINGSVEKSVIDLLKFLLENKKINGVFTLRKLGQNGSVDYALITDVSELNNAVPFYPLMPANAGKILSHFTLKKPAQKPIAAVVKPCELRAFIELVKREQGSLENFLFISSSCGGVLPIKTVEQEDFDKYIADYWDTVKNADISADIRPTCNACEYFTPFNADITVSLIGEKKLDKECRIFLNTDKANQVVKGFDGEISEEDFESSKISSLLDKRKDEKKKLFDELQLEGLGLDGMVEVFGKCIGCHGCNRVCPICYCILCDFESSTYDYNQSDFERDLNQKGGLRLPPDTIFYQIGRLTHMSFSCVGCGMCTDVCPVNIPLSTIFLKTGEETRQIFDYLPGKDVEEQIPVMIFKEDELTELGE
ncbi:MAG: Coenzyme F420 hydrogenase/dehydrogenase, beta subunit C-terminal domain [Candidatus Cloacimonetes bacterium]|nr:Coenzyme F420 hydrogenase/dehydrogenase, beta subunit C-terminal domain [Candidatus Cloacimonadota bacterium]